MSERKIFAQLPPGRRVWAVASIHGEVARLAKLHALLWTKVAPGDRLVYLGNVLGHGPDVAGTVDELLSFRRAFMAMAPDERHHVAILRGSQEEMWHKLLQLQFATDPRGVLNWMLDNGLAATLTAYGSSAKDAVSQASSGAVGLTRWTQSLRKSIQARRGHYDFFGAIRRAAFMDEGKVLFVNAGLDPTRPLDNQKDSFWWNSGSFSRISEPFGPYQRIVRGADPSRPGLRETAVTVTLDNGCGFGGSLLAGCFSPDGVLLECLEA
tara:strand:+ start:1387 stop:2187 length:801 start_codon:yes stop_codon:yes gene_type:complete